MPTKIELVAAPPQSRTLLILGRRELLRNAALRTHLPAGLQPLWERLLTHTPGGEQGNSATTWLPEGGPTERVAVGVLPEACSRHNAPSRAHAMTALIRKDCPAQGDATVVIVLEHADHAFASALAVARSFPLFTRKTAPATDRTVSVVFWCEGAWLEPAARWKEGVEAVRLAGRLVDTPPDDLHTEAFVEEALALVADLPGVEHTLITGERLRDAGFGGLWGVGRAARRKPALLALHWVPAGATRSFCWVGKGIVYDTGGLSLKSKEGMPGMKGDMGGAAAVLAAFVAAVRLAVPHRVHAVLCIAENAISPDSIRPDDILRLYSGKTVEVNNTDAEGRLVLGDGVAFASRHLKPEVIIDVATLTGAQAVATGKKHAGIVSNDEGLERAAIQAGRATGDLCHPLPYAPELFRREFKSEVADLKNSVKDRNNAQSACAAQFIAEHLVEFRGPWLHVDMAGPADLGERGSGFGVGLLLELCGAGR